MVLHPLGQLLESLHDDEAAVDVAPGAVLEAGLGAGAQGVGGGDVAQVEANAVHFANLEKDGGHQII